MQLHNINDAPRELTNLKWSIDIDSIISPVTNSYWLGTNWTLFTDNKNVLCSILYNMGFLWAILKTTFYFIINEFK